MTSESDTEFVERVSRAIYDRNSTHKDADLIRLFDLARRGAESADTITALRAENEKLDEAMEMLLTDVRRTDLDMSGLKAENERLSAYAKRAAMDVLLCKDGNILLHEKNEKLRAALEPLACTCDRPNGAACSRSEVDCPFWNARAALEGKQ